MKANQYIRPMLLKRSMALCILLFAAGVLWVGCGTQSAYFKASYSVEERFERSRLYPGLRYYTSGSLKYPLALVALDPNVKLESDTWQPIEMTSKKLYNWVSAMKYEPWVEYNQLPDGAVISDKQGKPVGFFYSVWQYPQVRFPADNRIEIDPPVALLRITNRVTADDNFGLGFD